MPARNSFSPPAPEAPETPAAPAAAAPAASPAAPVLSSAASLSPSREAASRLSVEAPPSAPAPPAPPDTVPEALPATAPAEDAAARLAQERLDAQREQLALVATTGELSSSRYEPRDLPGAITLARLVAGSPLCPAPLRGREADVLLVMMTGAEMGLTTMQALRNLYVINGRIGMSAAMIRARCQRHTDCDVFEVAEADAEHAVIEVRKRGWTERRRVTWLIADAERAGLITADSLWSRWPQEMCVARATTRAASLFFPEVASGILSEEELREMALPDADVMVPALVASIRPAAAAAAPGHAAPPAPAAAAGRDAPGGKAAPPSALDAFAAAGTGRHEGRPAHRKPPKRASARRAGGRGAGAVPPPRTAAGTPGGPGGPGGHSAAAPAALAASDRHLADPATARAARRNGRPGRR